MRIGIDCSCLAKPERTGVARYCEALVRELPGLLSDDDRVVLLYRVSRLARRRWFLEMDDPRFRIAYLNDRVVPLHPPGLDVVHGPDVRVPRIPRVPSVSTVHDLSALELPGIAGEGFRRRKAAALDWVSRRSAALICVSQTTEDTLVRRYPAAAGRTRVVPHGVAPRFRPAAPADVTTVRSRHGLRSPYVLFIGQIAARKNLIALVRAFGRLHARRPGLDLDLVLAGPHRFGAEDVVAAALSLPVAGRVRFLGFVDDALLPALYTGAEAFCFPGRAEGFGMPILEAMACGCPVVAARDGANPATAGSAAILFDPDDPASLDAAIGGAAHRGDRRDLLVERGLRRAAEFSWREAARRTLDAYRRAAAGVTHEDRAQRVGSGAA